MPGQRLDCNGSLDTGGSLFKLSAIAILSILLCSACSDEVSIQMREQTCGDLFCQHSDSVPFCQAVEDPPEGVPPAGTPLCQWSGSSCMAMVCDGEFPPCPTGSVCGENDSCLRSENLVGDRTYCKEDSDCVPEPCCRPTMCINRADAVCRNYACCGCRACMTCISACRCVDGCCVTEYDGSGCC